MFIENLIIFSLGLFSGYIIYYGLNIQNKGYDLKFPFFARLFE